LSAERALSLSPIRLALSLGRSTELRRDAYSSKNKWNSISYFWPSASLSATAFGRPCRGVATRGHANKEARIRRRRASDSLSSRNWVSGHCSRGRHNGMYRTRCVRETSQAAPTTPASLTWQLIIGSPSSWASLGCLPTKRGQCVITAQIIIFVMCGTARADNQT
jgi:hypothetical protein